MKAAATTTHFVYDSGTIIRMTDRQYRQFIAAGCDEVVNASDFGIVLGEASFNATRATTQDFLEERANIGMRDLADERRDWSVFDACNTCDAAAGKACCSTQKRYETSTPRTPSSTDARWRKTPHRGRPMILDNAPGQPPRKPPRKP